MSVDTSKIADTNRGKAATAKKPNKAGAVAEWADDRLSLGSLTRYFARKVFPDHWSFMLGEIALYSFIFLVLSGIYLALFFEPSSAIVIYHGRYAPMQGSRAHAAPE